MNELNDASIRALLKQNMPAVNKELRRDLWPQMLRRLDQRPHPRVVPWFDWALFATLIITISAFPSSIPLLLYHL
jgi:hypothetical protein